MAVTCIEVAENIKAMIFKKVLPTNIQKHRFS